MKKGILYIVPTPIGNLDDMTFRAIKILRSVSVIGAEDTRTSSKLMSHFNIDTPMISYHKFNERSRVEQILGKLEHGEDVAIISDAGTPGISDPASIIVNAVIEKEFRVEVLPGATAFVPALVSSGLNTEQFYFAGFLPEKKGKKIKFLEELKNIKASIIFYESPHNLLKFLDLLNEHFGDRRIAIGREISKLYETYYRTTLKTVLNEPDMITLKGEFVIVVEGAANEELDDNSVSDLLQQKIEAGASKKDAIKMVSKETGIAKNKLYDLTLKI